MTALAIRWSRRNPWGFLGVSAVLWWSLYQLLAPAAEALVVALPVTPESRLSHALQFFFYDTPKVLLLLAGVVFVMGMVNSYFTPERTRALLAGRHEGVANRGDTKGLPTSWRLVWGWSRRFVPARRCLCLSDSSRRVSPWA